MRFEKKIICASKYKSAYKLSPLFSLENNFAALFNQRYSCDLDYKICPVSMRERKSGMEF
jgi:hypothetical protein